MGRPSRREALARLFQAHYSELVRLAFALTGDWPLAEDLAQESFVRVWRRWGGIRRAEAAPAYLRTTVVNLARNSLRRRLRETSPLVELIDLGEPQHEAAPSVDLLRALRSLPQRKRACVVLRYYLDLSEADTAQVLGISIGTVKSQTARALRQLHELLDDQPTVTGEGRDG